jgi:hypothetical protein
MLAEHPNLGERLGKDGIAVRELLVLQDRGVRQALRARRPAARMHRRRWRSDGALARGMSMAPVLGRPGFLGLVEPMTVASHILPRICLG